MNKFNKVYVIQMFQKLLVPILILSLISAFFLLPLQRKFSPKYYSAQSQFIVEQPKNSINAGFSELYAKRINNYAIFAYGEHVLKLVSEKIDNKYTFKQLKSFLKVNYSSDSQIITLKVTTKTRKDSVKIANAFLEVIIEESPKYFSFNELKVLSKAKAVEMYTNVSRSQWYMISFVIFFMIYVVLISWLFILNPKICFDWQIYMITQVRKIYRI
ncbi:hypothetical protein WOQ_02705 [Enterococcus faecalis EnGen0340]|uniref:YveK family protein n=1 Tax=Enterococcus faecalis TaxID=1351 RepID=UPI0003304BD6|nr:hypothetical protein [Enterococcus faecalis]EOJ96023.1 hypothetical protein WOQ_02705 [Enterococcus faecalis EnGen0340]